LYNRNTDEPECLQAHEPDRTYVDLGSEQFLKQREDWQMWFPRRAMNLFLSLPLIAELLFAQASEQICSTGWDWRYVLPD